MKKYIVYGGVYTDTNFKSIASGGNEQKYGPYTSYKDAYNKWTELSWSNVDNCLHRFRITDTESKIVNT